MENFEMNGRIFTSAKEVNEYVATIRDFKELKKVLVDFDKMMLRMLYESMSKKNDKSKLTKLQWLNAIYELNN